jgi:hypothetical protein
VESVDLVQKFYQFFFAMRPDDKYHQHTVLGVICSIAFFSKSSMKKFAITGESGEPIATPSVCS